MRLEFVDDRNGRILVGALWGRLDWLGQTCAQPVESSIAAGSYIPRMSYDSEFRHLRSRGGSTRDMVVCLTTAFENGAPTQAAPALYP